MSKQKEIFYNWYKDIMINEDTNDIPKTAAGVLLIARDSGKILVQRRSTIVSAPHTYGCIGGHLQWGEKPIEAAYREFAEETGITLDANLIELHVSSKKEMKYHTFIGSIPNQVNNFTPDDEFADETDWFEWFYLDSLINLEDTHPGLKELLKDKESIIRKHVKNFMLKI